MRVYRSVRRRACAALALIATLAAATAAGATDYGRQNYLLRCAGCHVPDGTGSAPNDVPGLRGTPGQFVKVPEGRAFLAQVPGVAHSPLSDLEVAEVLNWILTTFSKDELPPDFKPYTAEEVTRYRAVRPADIFAVRNSVLRRLAADGIKITY